LVGDGPLRRQLECRADALGLRSVRFVGPVPKAEVPTRLAAMDACVVVLRDLPLYRYGVSLNKLADYLAAGVPVILSGKPANDIVAESGGGLSVPPMDPLALADAVERLSAMPDEERRRIGARGRAFVVEHRNWRDLAVRYEGVLLPR
ncbi:MAG: glycosyltransferase, partial [Candidatus Bipolaricaulota bacterium]